MKKGRSWLHRTSGIACRARDIASRGTNYTIFEHDEELNDHGGARADPRGDSEPNPIARTIPITKVAVAGGGGAVRARSLVYPHVRQLTYEPYTARGRGDGVLLLTDFCEPNSHGSYKLYYIYRLSE